MQYVIRIRNISAAELNDDFTVMVNGTGSVTYSPMTYCYKAQTSSNAKLANTVKALYLYWVEADKYFVWFGDIIMDREKYERTELEIIKFQTDDIITTSGNIPYEDNETSRIK